MIELGRRSPDLFRKFSASQNAASISDQRFKDPELGRGECDSAAASCDRPLIEIDREPAYADQVLRRRTCRPRTSQDCADVGGQQASSERFDYVVVCTGSESLDCIVL